MSEEYISRPEHEEFCKRMDGENNRQNERLTALEDTVTQLGAIVTSVEKLALNMKQMCEEQGKQGERLKVLEERDGEMWRKFVWQIFSVIIGIVVGRFF